MNEFCKVAIKKPLNTIKLFTSPLDIITYKQGKSTDFRKNNNIIRDVIKNFSSKSYNIKKLYQVFGTKKTTLAQECSKKGAKLL